MFTSLLFTTVLASSAVLRSQALVGMVAPNAPGPGDSFKQGESCHTSWAADDSGSTTAWKDMNIELMSGSNEAMVHLTTVATGQDGTVAGTFDYTCPEVTPNSAIYFYQFTAPGNNGFAWTTRFTIAAADGTTTTPTETETLKDGTIVPWGHGALVDPSTAVAAPTFNTTGSGSSESSGSSAGSAPTSGSSTPASSSSPSSTKPTSSPASRPVSTSSKSGNATNTAGAAQGSGSSAAIAVGPMVVDTRMWPVVAAMTMSAMAFTLLL